MAEALGMIECRGFTAEDFALSHPSGSLGKRLLLRVNDVMHSGDDIPAVNADATLSQGLIEMSQKGLGMTAIVGTDQQILGIFTDGDLRRILQDHPEPLNIPVSEVMTRAPKRVQPTMLAVDALRLMEAVKDHYITMLPVVDEHEKPVGALQIHDIIRAGIA